MLLTASSGPSLSSLHLALEVSGGCEPQSGSGSNTHLPHSATAATAPLPGSHQSSKPRVSHLPAQLLSGICGNQLQTQRRLLLVAADRGQMLPTSPSAGGSFSLMELPSPNTYSLELGPTWVERAQEPTQHGSLTSSHLGTLPL